MCQPQDFTALLFSSGSLLLLAIGDQSGPWWPRGWVARLQISHGRQKFQIAPPEDDVEVLELMAMIINIL